MKAYLITPDSQSVEPIDIASLEDIKRHIGFDTLASDAVGDEGDRLFFDEECFLRGTSGRFRIDNLIPVAGKGVVVGASDDGAALRDVVTDIEDLRGRIAYL